MDVMISLLIFEGVGECENRPALTTVGRVHGPGSRALRVPETHHGGLKKSGMVLLSEKKLKSPVLLKSTNTDPFAAWFVATGGATRDGIRVVRSVL